MKNVMKKLAGAGVAVGAAAAYGTALAHLWS